MANPIEFINTFQVDGVIFSGGNNLHIHNNNGQTSLNRDDTEKKLLDYCIAHKLPVIGICRGLQFIVNYCQNNLFLNQSTFPDYQYKKFGRLNFAN